MTPTRDRRIFVAGHRGMVGSAIVRALRAQGHSAFVFRTREELDLTDQSAVNHFFAKEKPDQVYLAAARVGAHHQSTAWPCSLKAAVESLPDVVYATKALPPRKDAKPIVPACRAPVMPSRPRRLLSASRMPRPCAMPCAWRFAMSPLT